MGQVKLGQIKSGQFKSGQIRSRCLDQGRSSQVKSVQEIQDRSNPDKLSQVGKGKVRIDQARKGQARTCKAPIDHFLIGQL